MTARALRSATYRGWIAEPLSDYLGAARAMRDDGTAARGSALRASSKRRRIGGWLALFAARAVARLGGIVTASE